MNKEDQQFEVKNKAYIKKTVLGRICSMVRQMMPWIAILMTWLSIGLWATHATTLELNG